jgi:hypothetical protein
MICSLWSTFCIQLFVLTAHFRFQDYEYVSFQPLALLPHWHYSHVTTLCIVTHLGPFLQPFSLILCEKNIEIWIILWKSPIWPFWKLMSHQCSSVWNRKHTYYFSLQCTKKNPTNLKGTSCSPLCKILMYKTNIKHGKMSWIRRKQDISRRK